MSAMSVLSFCQWLSHTSLSISLRESAYDYPVLLILHVFSIALFGGMVAMGNLRVLGIAMREVPVSQVISQFRPWKWLAFFILLVTGTLLTMSDPMEYYDNIMFWISAVLIVLVGLNAFIFRYGVYRDVATWDETASVPQSARLWASVSLFLWIAIIFAGRAIAFF
jgi:SNF family Na+-dependent transporter